MKKVKKVAAIGAGKVARALGGGWKDNGIDVIYGVRQLTDPKHGGLRIAPTRIAVQEADVVLLATPWEATEQALIDAGSLDGKILIDATNPIASDFSGLLLGLNDSGGEQVQRWANGARVVKAFNSIGTEVMMNPFFPEGQAMLLYAGNDADAKQSVHWLAQTLGFDPIDTGSIEQSRLLESLAWTWISLAVFHGYGRDIAFRLLRR